MRSLIAIIERHAKGTVRRPLRALRLQETLHCPLLQSLRHRLVLAVSMLRSSRW